MSEIRTIEITRTYDAPRAAVFRAWTEPEQFAPWFGAPLDTIAMDLRPGGTWKATLSYEGAEIPFHGVYLDVDAPRRLVFTLVDPNDPEFASRQAEGTTEEAVTLDFAEAAGKTTLTFRQRGSLPEEELAQAREGWVAWLDALGQHLASR